MKKLKLFVWPEACTDYTSGIMFAVAADVEAARQEILKKCNYVPAEDLIKTPEEWDLSVPRASITWGGG